MFRSVNEMSDVEKIKEINHIKRLLTLSNEGNIDSFLYKNEDTELLKNYDLCVAANGNLFRIDKQGFLPTLMERMYNDRTKYKKLMLEAKQRYEDNPNSEDEKLISRYHNMQLAKKIQLNSAYGALGNKYFRWFNFDLAESITSSGQLSIRWIHNKMNEFMNKILKTQDKDYIIAVDTDSIYINMEGLVKNIDQSDEIKIVHAIDQFCEEVVQPYINKSYEELAVYMNAYQQKMIMKRETIANKGIWRGKKMYILNAWNIEGVQYKEPVLKMNGVEAVRSSTPKICRDNLKKVLHIVMNKDEKELQRFMADFHNIYLTLPFEDIASPRGVKGLKKYNKDKTMIYDRGTPIHVKGALIYNNFIKENGLTNIPLIHDGDKIKFTYLKKPNPLFESVIAVPDQIPEELKFIEKYIDRELQYEKTFLGPVRSITDIVEWQTEKRLTLDDF